MTHEERVVDVTCERRASVTEWLQARSIEPSTQTQERVDDRETHGSYTQLRPSASAEGAEALGTHRTLMDLTRQRLSQDL
jgi:hypothetical protein